MASLDRIEVAGYKSIEKLDLELAQLNVLIGANGAGKSNFVSLFGLLNDLYEKRLQVHVARAGGADALLHFGQKHTQEISISLHFGRNGYEARLAPAATGGLFLAKESCWYTGFQLTSKYTVPLASGTMESGLAEEASSTKGRIAQHVEASLRSWKVYHFHDTSTSARMKQPCDLGDNSFLRPDGANLAAFLYLLERTHPREFQQIVAAIQMVAPFFEGFQLRPDPLNPQKIQLEWRERGSDIYFNAYALSDGTLRFIALATLLLQPRPPTTVVIDEPELGLHPYAIVLLTSLFRSAAQRSQIILSTQSVTLVNQLRPEDVIVVDRTGSASTFRRPSEAEINSWLEGYSLGELWEKNVIGGRPSRP